MEKLPTKIADEVWQCSLDLAPWIGQGNSVSAFTVETISGPVVVSNASLADADTGVFRVSGGTPRSSSQFRAFAEMADGQVFGQTFSVFVE